jgi:hypothetical protein
MLARDYIESLIDEGGGTSFEEDRTNVMRAIAYTLLDIRDEIYKQS